VGPSPGEPPLSKRTPAQGDACALRALLDRPPGTREYGSARTDTTLGKGRRQGETDAFSLRLYSVACGSRSSRCAPRPSSSDRVELMTRPVLRRGLRPTRSKSTEAHLADPLNLSAGACCLRQPDVRPGDTSAYRSTTSTSAAGLRHAPPARALPLRRARLGEGEESRVLALRA
jgi:hypothetical protein